MRDDLSPDEGRDAILLTTSKHAGGTVRAAMTLSSRARYTTLAAVLCAASLAVAPSSAWASPQAVSGISSAAQAGSSTRVAASSVRLKALELKVLRKLNAYRGTHERAPVRMQKQLRRAALVHARAMAKRGFFAHESANGEPFDARTKRYYGVRGFRSWSVGENLLWASGDLDAKRAITLWDGSPGHSRNMREGGWREIGVAAVRVRSAPGVFQGFDVTIVVTDFGTRS